MDEQELIYWLKDNDEDAFRYLMDIYGDRLYKTIFLIIGDKEEAKDILQETFLKVHKNIKKFNGNSSLYTWIYAIAVNECRDRFKKSISEIPLNETLLHTKENVEDIIDENINREIVRNELICLPAIYREVLVLFYFNDMTIKEISEITDEKEGTIKSKLSRGRNILKRSLVKEGFK